jgi:acetoin utilization protein AcuB
MLHLQHTNMYNHQLLATEIPNLLPTDTGEHALDLMQEHHVSHLPLIDGDHYLTLINEQDLLEWAHPEQALSTAPFPEYKPMVYGYQHPYEAIKRMVQQNITVVPILDEQHHYLGLITPIRLLQFIATNSSLDLPGGIIILDIKPMNYSLSEIAKIAEQNDCLITHVQVFYHADQDSMEVVIKTNNKEIQSLVATFERYEYTVVDSFGDKPAIDSLVDRYQSLMHYINM